MNYTSSAFVGLALAAFAAADTPITLTKGDTALVAVSTAPYFTANGLTDPNSMFPDTMVLTVNGADPGNCAQQFVLGQIICGNYRFRCAAVVSASPVTDAGNVYLVDMNAQALARSGDPKGTCYATPGAAPDGTPVLTILAFVAAERQLYAQDVQATRGLIQFLVGGSAAIPQGAAGLTFALQYNPRVGDPATFTISAPISAFTTTMNSEYYPNPSIGTVQSIRVIRAVKDRQ